ncbi:MAG: hypothetical protein K9G38_03145 [Bacteroidales bacterium]|nr:hypothetical protein [Bacteroidales bacterium]
MSELTDKELRILNKEIEREGLTYTDLQNELLDHLCCDIEVKMDDGKAFLQALEEVKNEMGKDCIRQIQEDTLLLINQKYKLMKKIMYIIGSVAPILVIAGTVFKVQHWPGASIMLVVGLFLLAAVYLPVFVSIKIRDTRKEGKPVNKGVYYIGLISGIIFILGAMFKIMHWPGASIMITLAGLVTVAVFIPMLVVNAIRDKENQVQSFTILIFFLSFIAIAFMSFALRISKSVMDSFDLAAVNNTITANALYENNIYYLNESLSGRSTMENIDVFTGKIDKLNGYIENTMVSMVKEAHDKNAEAVDSNNNIDFRLVRNKDNMNAPAYIMLGIENNVARGEVIKEMIEDLKASITDLESERLTALAAKLLDTSPVKDEENASWVSHNFEHVPLMSVMVQLTNIQVNTRIIETAILNYYGETTADKTITE